MIKAQTMPGNIRGGLTLQFPPFWQGLSWHLFSTLVSQFLPVKPIGQEQV